MSYAPSTRKRKSQWAKAILEETFPKPVEDTKSKITHAANQRQISTNKFPKGSPQ